MRLHVAVLLAVISSQCLADRRLDPTVRDEDVSLASFTSKVTELPDGRFEYHYFLHSPSNSKGTISAVEFDVYCEEMPDIGPQQSDRQRLTGHSDNSRDGRHLKLSSKLNDTDSPFTSISRDNIFMLTLENGPGQSQEFVLFSEHPPGLTPYSFRISEVNEKRYDYWDEEGQLKNENAPWYERWEVHGIIAGPVCTNKATDSISRPTFGGQRMPMESRDIDALLRFEVPERRNRWHVSADVESVELRIYYSLFINKHTFKAIVNGIDHSARFTPTPGESETVLIPLQGDLTVIDFSVDVVPDHFTDYGDYDAQTDVDQLEIRKFP